MYHNRAGAFTEALNCYCLPSQAAATLAQKQSLVVLDVCFGLGYNTFVLLEHLCQLGCAGSVDIFALEIDSAILRCVEDIFEDSRLRHVAAMFADKQPTRFGFYKGQCRSLEANLHVIEEDFRQFIAQREGGADLVFHDPFSPNKLPQLWTVDIFQHYYRLLLDFRGSLLTYSAASAVRAGLREAGFQVFRTAAIGGKNGGTLAATGRSETPPEGTEHLSDDERRRLDGRPGIPYRDPSLKAARQDILLRRMHEQALFR
jgi:tRNA U34 5-methylaminomethyl-2-thiouridine-forming methyltransferase MnmC